MSRRFRFGRNRLLRFNQQANNRNPPKSFRQRKIRIHFLLHRRENVPLPWRLIQRRHFLRLSKILRVFNFLILFTIDKVKLKVEKNIFLDPNSFLLTDLGNIDDEYIRRYVGQLDPFEESCLVQLRKWVGETHKGKVRFFVEFFFSFRICVDFSFSSCPTILIFFDFYELVGSILKKLEKMFVIHWPGKETMRKVLFLFPTSEDKAR